MPPPVAETKGSSLRAVKARLHEVKRLLVKKYPIRSLAIFGSVSRGDNSPQSDGDILAEFNGPIGIGFIRLAYELEEILGRKVDLVSRGGIKDRYFEVIEHDLLYV